MAKKAKKKVSTIKHLRSVEAPKFVLPAKLVIDPVAEKIEIVPEQKSKRPFWRSFFSRR